MGGTERRVFRRRHDDLLLGGKLARDISREQAVGRDRAPADDRHHARDHIPADVHPTENEVIVPAHQEHRRVQQDAAGDQDYAEHEGP